MLAEYFLVLIRELFSQYLFVVHLNSRKFVEVCNHQLYHVATSLAVLLPKLLVQLFVNTLQHLIFDFTEGA